MSEDSEELFERIGGTLGLTNIVNSMYEKVLADPELAPIFEHANMDRIRKMQFEFLAGAFDGPLNYAGVELTAAHRNRGIRAHHFAQFCTHFAEAAREHGATDRDIDMALGRLATYKDKITGDSNVDG
ncbi:group I truncated hemoglobin [Planctomycetes bacterium CA13]